MHFPDSWAKLLNEIKNIPLWILIWMAFNVTIFYFFPPFNSFVSAEFKNLLFFSMVILVSFILFRSYASHKERRLRKTFHLEIIPHH